MQFVYVLTSGYNDIYYEQLLLSVTSIRLFNPNSNVVLFCDTKTKETLIGKRSGYENFVSNLIVLDTPEHFSQVEVSRWIKTSIHQKLSSDFLYIDCDTIIADDLSSIADLDIKFGACLDKHSLINNHAKGNDFIKRDKKLGFNSYLSNRHYNGGLIFCAYDPEAHKIFERWHELWLFSKSKKIISDQASLNMAIYENDTNFTELDGIWNCQISFNGLPYLANSKIIHYFATDSIFNASPFIFANDNLFRQIKDNGFIPKEFLDKLKNPRSSFVSESRIIAGEDMLFVINSSLFESIFWFKRKIPIFYNFLNYLFSLNKKIIKYFLIKINKRKAGRIEYYN